MTPSSSMQGLSLINWLCCGVGFPKLKAVNLSRNVSHCAKLTISSSASYNFSGNNSRLAFLLSLLHMLCSTLLGLACTRTKCVQLENCFRSSLSSGQGLQRHSRPPFSLRFFISGILLGLFETCIFDHSLESFVNKSGAITPQGTPG